MTIATVDPAFPFGADMSQFDVGLLSLGTVAAQSSTSFTIALGDETVTFTGTNLTYGANGLATGGVITGIQDSYQGATVFTMQGLTVSAADFATWVSTGDNATAQATIFAGADTVTGAAQSDLLRAYGGSDSINGGGGDDTLDGGTGDDTLDGGGGADVIITGGGKDVIIVGQGETSIAPGGAEVISDWSSSDIIRFAHAPTFASEFATGAAADYASAATYANGLIAAGSVNVVAVAVGADVVVFADSAGDNGVADDVVVLSGRTLADVSGANFGATAVKAPPLPTAPTGLKLDAATDGGKVGDNLTNAKHLTIDGVAGAGVHVTLFDGATAVGSADADAVTGAFSITTAAALADGTHTLTAQASNSAGTSGSSAALSIKIDSVGPAAPTSLKLDAATDSGAKGDGVTNIGQVKIDGVAEKGATVTLFDGTTVVGTATADASTGAFVVQASAPLSGGAHVLGVQATDIAGNLGAKASLNVTIDNQVGTAAITGFTDSTQSGRTSVTITGTVTDAKSTVNVFEDGASIGAAKVSNGAWSFTASKVSNVIHTFTVQTTDAAGNTGAGIGTIIFGSSSSEKITGGAGAEFIHGGGGADTIAGGGGADVFVYDSLSDAAPSSKGSPVEVITDFQDGVDRLDLSHLGHMTYGGQATLASHGLIWSVSGGNTFISGDTSGDGRADFTIELLGVHNLTKGDFLLG